MEFVDTAGLVKAHRKAKVWGNQFLTNIRETAIGHVVRCFENDNIIHASAKNRRDDIEAINTEPKLADPRHLRTCDSSRTEESQRWR